MGDVVRRSPITAPGSHGSEERGGASRPVRMGIVDRRAGRATYFLIAFPVLLAAFFPVKEIGFLLPFVAAAVCAIILRRSQRGLLAVVAYVGIWAAYSSVHMLLEPGFELVPASLSLVSFSSFLFLLAVPSELVGRIPRPSLIRLCIGFLTVQGGIGVVQGILWGARSGGWGGPAGDAVEGTLHLAIAPSLSFSNPTFAVVTATLLLFVVSQRGGVARRWAWYLGVVLGLGAFALASVWHVAVYAVVAALAAGVGLAKWLRPSAAIGIVVAILAGGLWLPELAVQPAESLRTYSSLLSEGRLPKNEVIQSAMHELPAEYPYVYAIGLGPGQFSSRAALVASGLYAGGAPGSLQAGSSPAFDRWFAEPFVRSQSYLLGSTGQPAFSWLTLLVEFGPIPVALCAIAGLIVVLRAVTKLARSRRESAAWFVFTAVAFMGLLGVQENYYETPQAVLPALLLVKWCIGSPSSVVGPRTQGPLA